MPLSAAAADRLKWILENYFNLVYFIRDPLPSNASGFDKWGQAALRRHCQKIARDNPPGLNGGPIWGGLCGPYLDSINEGPIDNGDMPPTFTGGQCEGTIYKVIVTLTLGTDIPGQCATPYDISVNGVSGVPGPIRGISLGSVVIPGANLPGKSAALNYGQNQQISLGETFGGCNTPYAVIKSVTRLDGGPDTCGNPPPPVYDPPTFPPNLPPLAPPTVPYPDGGLNWEVNLDIDGDIILCFPDGCTEVKPPGTLPPAPAPAPPLPGTPDGPPLDTPPSPPGNPVVSGCLAPGKVLTGLKISFLETSEKSAWADGFYTRVAWILFGDSSTTLDLSKDGNVLRNGQFVIPDSENCSCFEVIARPGWRLRVQPYSRTV